MYNPLVGRFLAQQQGRMTPKLQPMQAPVGQALQGQSTFQQGLPAVAQALQNRLQGQVQFRGKGAKNRPAQQPVPGMNTMQGRPR